MQDFGPATDSILPIPIREGLTVYVQGIPHDLSEAEASKIARVVVAYARKEEG